jgi:aminomethyltransferase
MSDDFELKQLPLGPMHEAAGARFGGFAGWSMPITYPLGVLKEHLHVREHAGLFDISHMKLFLVTGKGAAATLGRACPLQPQNMADGQSRYSFFLDEHAGILDDLIVTRLGAERFVVVANAGNAQADEAHLRQVASTFDVAIRPLERAFLALQGPGAEKALSAAGLDGSGLSFMEAREPDEGWFLSRSGYTGEDGFEIAIPLDQAEGFASKLLEQDDVEWIGLAARDSLRLEAGLCLHGQDITADTTPAQAGLVWAVPKPLRGGGDYIGAAALAAAIAAGLSHRRVGLKPEGRQPVRGGANLQDEEGTSIGTVTSGGFGPSAGHPVAMGLVRTDLAPIGTRIFVEVRGTRVPLTVSTLPFIPHRYRRG